jgi:hypothetical protein
MAIDLAQAPGNAAVRAPFAQLISDALARLRASGDSRSPAGRVATAARSGGGGRERATAVLARGLGWFSLGLGVVELAAPGVFERVVGARGKHRILLPAIGVREIISGVAILSSRRPLPLWLWARVAGDLVDLGMLVASMRREDPRKARRATATAERSHTRAEKPPRSIVVDRPLEECRRLWHAFSESPRFHRDFATLRSVDFETGPAGRGTMIRVSMPTGNMKAEFFAQEALRKFKQVVETGRNATTHGPQIRVHTRV